MRFVQHAAIRPHRCAVVPFIGNSNSQEGFIDTGYDLPGWDPHVYVSVQAVKEMAGLIGWGPRLASPELERTKTRVTELEAERDGLRAQLAAVEVLKNVGGFEQARRPGRPKQKAGV